MHNNNYKIKCAFVAIIVIMNVIIIRIPINVHMYAVRAYAVTRILSNKTYMHTYVHMYI